MTRATPPPAVAAPTRRGRGALRLLVDALSRRAGALDELTATLHELTRTAQPAQPVAGQHTGTVIPGPRTVIPAPEIVIPGPTRSQPRWRFRRSLAHGRRSIMIPDSNKPSDAIDRLDTPPSRANARTVYRGEPTR